uniref:ATP synthase complex subunit 8 n=1 Tax=Anolis cybotes TaxID=38891 RepID=C4T892_9SAUR|nr:ATPase subunit8 [Anolis cybotes]
MPQLNPSPWLMIFLMTWTMFLLFFLNKTTKYAYQNTPLMKKMKETTTRSWNWPWY